MNIILQFLWLLFLFSVPLWIAASILDATKIIPVALPLSALQFLVVILVSIIVTRRSDGSVRELLLRGIDIKRIKNLMWRGVIFVLMPLNIALSYLMIVWSGASVPDKMTPLLGIPVMLLVYGISGYCEELGWTAIMTDQLLKRRTVVVSGIIVGVVWALWHLIPFIQTHNTAAWIFWQCIYTVIARVQLTKVYVMTNHSVFSTVALHATYNVAFSMMPYYGSSYDPMYMAFATLITTIVLFILPNSPSNNEHAVH